MCDFWGIISFVAKITAKNHNDVNFEHLYMLVGMVASEVSRKILVFSTTSLRSYITKKIQWAVWAPGPPGSATGLSTVNARRYRYVVRSVHVHGACTTMSKNCNIFLAWLLQLAKFLVLILSDQLNQQVLQVNIIYNMSVLSTFDL